MIRGISVAGICLVLLGAAFACRQVYVQKQNALYRVEAQITVQMPDVNGFKEEQIRTAGQLGNQDGEEKQIDLEASDDMLSRMLAEYESRFEKVSVTREKCEALDHYVAALNVPSPVLSSVFETSKITAADTKIWSRLGTLDTTYDTLDPDSYYFMKDKAFQNYFMEERKQIPISFRAPVLYVNTNMVNGEEWKARQKMTDLKELTDKDGKLSYCVSRENLAMYQKAFHVPEGTEEFSVKESDKEKGYEPFLRREKAYYLGNTDDYEAVRASLGGIYQIVVMEEMQKNGRDGERIKGQSTHLWSINGELYGEQKTAADSLVYYLMSETAQDVFNLQCGNGLSMNKNMLKTYVESNDEFRGVFRGLDYLEMEYGEESGS